MTEAVGDAAAVEQVIRTLRREGLRGELLRVESLAPLIAERCRHHAMDPTAYGRAVERDAAERAWWRAQIAVPETWLFRYPASFEHLLEWAAVRFRSAGAGVRVLSVACANGAEPFSIAATLHAASRRSGAGERPRCSVLGLDPNMEALRQAREGRLPPLAVRGSLPCWAQPDFTMDGGRALPSTTVRGAIDWVCDSAPDALLGLPAGAFDAVFCRNLAIYLDEPNRLAIGVELRRLLAAGGQLYLGHVERPAHFGLDDAFVPVPGSAPGALVFERAALTRLPSSPPAPAARPTGAGGPPLAVAPQAKASQPAAPTLADAQHAADEGRVADAAAVAQSLHDAGMRDPALLRLLGVLALASGDDAAAEGWLRKAEYASPGEPDALLHLALLAERRGDAGGAARLRARAAVGAVGEIGENAAP